MNENGFLTFTAAYNFRQKCYEFCQNHGIFYLFTSPNVIHASVALSLTQTSLNIGEQVLILSQNLQGLLIGLMVIREASQFRIIYEFKMYSTLLNEQSKVTVLGNPKPKKIILVRQNTDPIGFMDGLCFFFRRDNAFVLSPLPINWCHAIADTVAHMMEEKFYQFKVAFPCPNNYFVCKDKVPLFQSTPLFQNIYFEAIPFEKSHIIAVDSTKYVSLIAKASATVSYDELIKDIPLLKFKSKTVKVTLKVDVNSFYDFKVEAVEEEKAPVEKLSYFVAFENEKQQSASKKPQIWFTQDHYYILDGQSKINDAEKFPLYISFAEEKPAVGHAAKEMYSKKPDFVVFDIIKLCSNSSSNVMGPKLTFTNENELLMVTVKTFKGERQASADFLLAMIIKDALNKIQQNLNKNMEEIKIGFDGFIADENLKQNFVKAAERLKIKIAF
uniref:Uncharacterized protein n=1 Tax=Panagrolaimus sp. ES5 TaxID=591445 RepID=A0AC34FES3_9BILA